MVAFMVSVLSQDPHGVPAGNVITPEWVASCYGVTVDDDCPEVRIPAGDGTGLNDDHGITVAERIARCGYLGHHRDEPTDTRCVVCHVRLRT